MNPPQKDRGADGASPESFAYKYLRMDSEAARAARRMSLGSDAPNGYTTVAQAERISRLLDLGPGRLLLDLGSGRGWPGRLVAEKTGCDLVIADLPLEGLRQARGAVRVSAAGWAGIVCGDGRRPPFREGTFHGVTHTDVLC